MAQPDEKRCRLYLVTPPKLEPAGFAAELALALEGGDVACVQLRLEAPSDDELLRACEALRPVAQGRGVAFLIKDRPDIAARTGADGVHIDDADLAQAEVRRLLGRDAIIGIACHDSRHLAIEAAEAGADYVSFGAFFSATGAATGHPAPDILTWWSDIMTVPCVAAGGITVENCGELVNAGADFIAVSSAVWRHPGGAKAAVAAFNAAIQRAVV